ESSRRDPGDDRTAVAIGERERDLARGELRLGDELFERLATVDARLDVVVCATMRYMSQPLSLRLPDATLDRLGARARSRSVAPRTLAQRYVEEGLRIDEHPLIRFVDGPAGRRPRLLGTGLDVWAAIWLVRDNDGD